MPLARTTIQVRGSRVVVERRALGPSKSTPNYSDPIPQTGRTVAATLYELASRVRRLTIDRRDPHRFFEDQSEIAFAIEQLAGAIGR